MLRFFQRTLTLDQGPFDIARYHGGELIGPAPDCQSSLAWFRKAATYLVEGSVRALALLHLEENQSTQVAAWCRPAGCTERCWILAPPFCEPGGTYVIDYLRRRSRASGPRVGALILKYRGAVQRVEVYSPHGWDVRVYHPDHKPDKPFYETRFCGHDEAQLDVLSQEELGADGGSRR